MKIDTTKVLTGFDGKELKYSDGEVMTVGNITASALSAGKEGGKMKLYILATKFYSDNEVEVDAADLSLVKKAIEVAPFNAVITGQILAIFEEVKELRKKNEEA